MKFVTVKKDFDNGFILVTAKLYTDQLTIHTVYYDGRFSDVKLYVRYSADPIDLDESIADEIVSQVKYQISILEYRSGVVIKKKHISAFNRRRFLPKKWSTLRKKEVSR